ncbi:MAG TPA: hypothetical protein VLQ90_04885 [Pyrinomonadaceae bacterium]|nr:hypothetical protein [Pyrinomonadaceae bacterium]
MHDCKATQERLNELAASGEDEQLLNELRQCEACSGTYASLQSTLRLADQAIRAAAPADDFWPAYHARLRQSLESVSKVDALSRPAERSGVLASFLAFLATSVRVPVPIAAILLLVLGATIVFGLRSRRSPVTVPAAIVTKTVEVPVIHEKTVTQVVYRYRDRREVTSRKANANLMVQQQNERAPVSLSGFTPTSEVKLTIIKGSYQNEK